MEDPKIPSPQNPIIPIRIMVEPRSTKGDRESDMKGLGDCLGEDLVNSDRSDTSLSKNNAIYESKAKMERKKMRGSSRVVLTLDGGVLGSS